MSAADSGDVSVEDLGDALAQLPTDDNTLTDYEKYRQFNPLFREWLGVYTDTPMDIRRPLIERAIKLRIRKGAVIREQDQIIICFVMPNTKEWCSVFWVNGAVYDGDLRGSIWQDDVMPSFFKRVPPP